MLLMSAPDLVFQMVGDIAGEWCVSVIVYQYERHVVVNHNGLIYRTLRPATITTHSYCQAIATKRRMSACLPIKWFPPQAGGENTRLAAISLFCRNVERHLLTVLSLHSQALTTVYSSAPPPPMTLVPIVRIPSCYLCCHEKIAALFVTPRVRVAARVTKSTKSRFLRSKK